MQKHRIQLGGEEIRSGGLSPAEGQDFILELSGGVWNYGGWCPWLFRCWRRTGNVGTSPEAMGSYLIVYNSMSRNTMLLYAVTWLHLASGDVTMLPVHF